MNAVTKAMLLNKDVIAVDQDAAGVQGFKHTVKDSLETWFKPLAGGDWAVCFLNRSKKAQPVSFDWSREAINDAVSKQAIATDGKPYLVSNLWTKQAMGNTGQPLTANVPSHDVLMVRLRKQ
jgi:alpha-galactosidase